MSRMSDFVELLKQHLRDHKDQYIEHNSWNGNTESGFYATDDFDMGKLLAQIDAFTAWFQGPRTEPFDPNVTEESK